MNEKIDKVIEKLTGLFDVWLEGFEKEPVKTAIKVFLILWLVKQARKALR